MRKSESEGKLTIISLFILRQAGSQNKRMKKIRDMVDAYLIETCAWKHT